MTPFLNNKKKITKKRKTRKKFQKNFVQKYGTTISILVDSLLYASESTSVPNFVCFLSFVFF